MKPFTSYCLATQAQSRPLARVLYTRFTEVPSFFSKMRRRLPLLTKGILSTHVSLHTSILIQDISQHIDCSISIYSILTILHSITSLSNLFSTYMFDIYLVRSAKAAFLINRFSSSRRTNKAVFKRLLVWKASWRWYGQSERASAFFRSADLSGSPHASIIVT